MKFHSCTVFLGVSQLLLMGCNVVKEAVSTTSKYGVVALFDISASTDQDAVRQRYRKEFLEIIGQLTTQDGMIVRADAIRATPLAETTFPIRIVVPRMSVINKNDFELEDAVKKAKDSAEEEVTRLFAQSGATQRTPILDAIEVAGRILEGQEMKDIPDRRLVIFSDMIESSERYEFTKIGLGRTAMPQIVEKEKQAKRLPDLHGVRVWVAGAGAGGGQGLAGERLRWIEEFWLEYFRAAGAELPNTQYGSALLNFSAKQ